MRLELPSQTKLHDLFVYNEGQLIWRQRPQGMFSTVQSCNSWNAKYAGQLAGTPDGRGYFKVGINKTIYKLHRIIYKMFHGTDPIEIDHIDGNKMNNNIDNLRSATRKGNCRNYPIRKDNTSGVTGVYWYKRLSLWNSTISANGKHIKLGYFHDKFEAIAARKSAEIRYGFHPNHGRQSTCFY